MEAFKEKDMDEDRRGELRLTTVLPTLEIDGKRRALVDFSTHGFRAKLPDTYREIGTSGKAILDIQAAGYNVRKTIEFTVLRVDAETVGVRYETLDTVSEASMALF